MVIWMFRLEAHIAVHGLRGAAAIEHVFAATGEVVQESPERWRRMLAHFAGRPPQRPLPVLTRADQALLAPELGGRELELLGAGRLFIRCVEEGRRDGELPSQGSAYEVAHFLGALLHGTATIGHSSRDTDWRRLYRRHVRRALGRLTERDPHPPAVPAKYRKGQKR
jgi:hypothetical protein